MIIYLQNMNEFLLIYMYLNDLVYEKLISKIAMMIIAIGKLQIFDWDRNIASSVTCQTLFT